MKNNFEVAVDIGGAGTKIGHRLRGSSGRWGVKFLRGTEHHNVFEEPECVGERLVHAIVKAGAPRVSALAISTTGIVDHRTQRLIRSDRLNKIAEARGGFPPNFDLLGQLHHRLLPGANVSLCNDSVACAAATAIRHGATMPLLSLTLGSFPAVAIAHKPESNAAVRIIPKEGKWTSEIIGTASGRLPLFATINDAALNGLVHGEGKPDWQRRGRRVGRAMVRLLELYLQEYGILPLEAVVRGGNAIGLTECDLHAGMDEELSNRSGLSAKGDRFASVSIRIDGKDYQSYVEAQLDGVNIYREWLHLGQVVVIGG